MRLGNITINGTDYPLCFSVSILVGLEERGENVSDILGGKDMTVTRAFHLLADMIDAGIKYKRLTDSCELTAPTFDELTALVGPDEFSDVFKAINGAIADGQKRTVEAEPPKDRKNVKATRGEN